MEKKFIVISNSEKEVTCIFDICEISYLRRTGTCEYVMIIDGQTITQTFESEEDCDANFRCLFTNMIELERKNS